MRTHTHTHIIYIYIYIYSFFFLFRRVLSSRVRKSSAGASYFLLILSGAKGERPGRGALYFFTVTVGGGGGGGVELPWLRVVSCRDNETRDMCPLRREWPASRRPSLSRAVPLPPPPPPPLPLSPCPRCWPMKIVAMVREFERGLYPFRFLLARACRQF